MTAPLLSVVMCAYNEEKYIKKAIESILNQSFRDFELIIIDDLSSDQTRNIIEEFTDERIVVLTNDENMGPYRSANKGIAIARGEFIARHDADDMSMPDRFRLQLDILLNHPAIGLVSTDFHYIDESDRIIDSVTVPEGHDILFARLTTGNVFSQGALMFRKEIFYQLGGYRDELPVSQDYDMWLRFSEVTQLENIPQKCYLMRFHGNSISRNKRALQLSCKDFAWDQALKRRSGEPELPLPTDILQAYPPGQYLLFLDARGMTYLYYASGNNHRAEESLRNALNIQPDAGLLDQSWIDWAKGRAILLADLRKSSQEGANFLNWFLKRYLDPHEKLIIQKNLADFHIQQAFEGHYKGDRKQVLRNVVRAALNDAHSLENRGLWSIFFKSLFIR